jgi:hypothetical protein
MTGVSVISGGVNGSAFSSEAFSAWPAHLARPAELFEPSNNARAGIDLKAQYSVAGRGRFRVVKVVP